MRRQAVFPLRGTGSIASTIGRLRFLFPASLLTVIAVACTTEPGYTPGAIQVKSDVLGTRVQGGMGVLTGKVTRGPLSPVEGIGGVPASAPVPDARIVISSLDGQEIGSLVTDGQGRYTISLPQGTYRVTMPRLSGAGWTKDLPATVTITEGRETRLDIRIDTGIR